MANYIFLQLVRHIDKKPSKQRWYIAERNFRNLLPCLRPYIPWSTRLSPHTTDEVKEKSYLWRGSGRKQNTWPVGLLAATLSTPRGAAALTHGMYFISASLSSADISSDMLLSPEQKWLTRNIWLQWQEYNGHSNRQSATSCLLGKCKYCRTKFLRAQSLRFYLW